MAYRFFEGSNHAVLYSKFRPITPPTVIAKIVNFLKEKLTSPLQHALDVGCGSGQSTPVLAPYFKKVTGIDISNAQISEAEKNNTFPNIEYKTYPGEKIPLDDGSLQLITACQSAHWFNLPEFYKEADRLLVPHGVLALYGYSLPLPIHSNETITRNAQKVVLQFYDDDMGSYFPPQRAMVDNCYKDFTLPYKDNIRTSVTNDVPCKLSDYFNYFKTWSPYEKLRKEDPERAESLISGMYERLQKALEAPSTDTPITLRSDYFILMGRKDG